MIPDRSLDEAERAELDRLREEVLALRGADNPPTGRRIRWKSVAAIVLIVVGCVLAPLSATAVWAHNQVANTDRFVATMAPLAADPSVQAALTDRVTQTVFTYVNVPQLTNEAVDALAARGLPPRAVDGLRGLSGPLSSGVQGFVHGRVGDFVASPAFQTIWARTLRVVHQQVDRVLAGDATAVTVQNGQVVLQLGPIIAQTKQHLIASGFGAAKVIPNVNPTFPVANADGLVKAQGFYRLLNTVADWLPWVALILLAAGCWLARSRRRALLGIGIGVAVSMLVLAAGLAIARHLVVTGVPPRSVAPAGAAYDIVVTFLRYGLRTVAVVGLVVALGAFLAGPSSAAVGLRRGCVRALAWLRGHGPAAVRGGGPVGTWVHRYLVPLRCALVGVAVLVFLFLNRPNGWDVLVIALVLLFCLGVLQFLDHPAAKAEPPVSLSGR